MDQLGAMRVFVRVVQMGSFSAAAREQNTTQATISKKVAALEAKLSAKLLSRTSRELSLTEVGADYYERCMAILSELEEADANARSQMATPSGLLRVAAPVVFARQFIAPILSEFLTLYPDIQVDLLVSDKHVDLIADGVDVAIRAKQLEDSNFVARHLFDNPFAVAAAPQYLKQSAVIKTAEDLKDHNCIVYSMLKSINIWHFEREGHRISVPVTGRSRCDNGDVILQLALDGEGIVHLPIWMLDEHVRSGRLELILQDYESKPLPFNAIYLQSRYVPLKVRCFIDYIKQKLSEDPQYH
ncbi:putative HTH-type transcriptional regulator LtrA [Vibrio scophthalmi]|uniref:LysR family transcriptional regulator n=1 Tax=Vibrio scophthalmi LMG 19158 TaxID=870967 RepID=F9RND2_9VIBR|nr:LysR family transcriptional regulator [Vibrio scophthalmi]ANS88025.1 putative HTH-type transcriptional regulator LtrA [Vibrio scophthalmi]EGU36957.1 LysR family transcriptional regulator [Vibrio scophthalmi LMG 19158]